MSIRSRYFDCAEAGAAHDVCQCVASAASCSRLGASTGHHIHTHTACQETYCVHVCAHRGALVTRPVPVLTGLKPISHSQLWPVDKVSQGK